MGLNMSDAEETEKIVAQPVIDVNNDMILVQAWYQQARQVVDGDGLQSLLIALLGDVKYTPATTPHAFTAIALAALKLANNSKHGPLTNEQWVDVADLMGQAMSNDLQTVTINLVQPQAF